MKRIFAVLMAAALLLSTLTVWAVTDNEIFPDNTVNVVAIGGSITAGAGASQDNKAWFGASSNPGPVGQWFKNRFPSKTVNIYNAGIGGTGSNYGLFRLGRDVISKSPDYVIVEFAVNDSAAKNNAAEAERTKQYMEGIVRQLLSLPKQPYIMFLYTTTADQRACVDVHNEVAEAYGIPTLDLQAYIHGQYAASHPNYTQQDVFWSDGVHPNDAGYKVYSDYMTTQLANTEKYFKKAKWPTPLTFGREFTNTKIIPAQDVVQATGSWTEIEHGGEKYFQSNREGDKLEFWFTGNAFGMISLMDNKGGAMRIDIDSDFSDTVTPYLDYLQNPMQNTYFSSRVLSQGWHKATVTVTSTSNGTRLARVGFFFVDQEIVLPPTVTAVEAGGRTIKLSAGEAVRLPAGATEFNIVFDKPMDLKTLSSNKIIVKKNGQTVPINGKYGAADKKFEVKFSSPIENETIYTVTVDKSAASQAVTMGADFSFMFESTTRPAFLSAAFKNFEGGVVTSLAGVNYLTANISVENTLAIDERVTVMAVLYRGDEILRLAKAEIPAFKAGAKKKYTASFNIPSDKANLKIKAFVLDASKNVISREVILQ